MARAGENSHGPERTSNEHEHFITRRHPPRMRGPRRPLSCLHATLNVIRSSIASAHWRRSGWPCSRTPDAITAADREDVLRWATRFYYATEKAGRYAMAAAVSRERGVQAALDTIEDYTCFPTSRRPAKQLHLYKLMATKAITAFLQGLEGLRGPIRP